MPSWAEVRTFVEGAEGLGLDSVWVSDHLVSAPPGQPPEGIHEGWTILVEAYEALAVDELIVGLRPPTERSLERLATPLRTHRCSRDGNDSLSTSGGPR
jgi:hypothetical protein